MDFPLALKQLFAELGLKTDSSQQLLWSKCQLYEGNKMQLIFSKDKANEFEYILVDGILHRFNMNDKGEIITTGLYMGPRVITPHFARTVNNKNIFSLQALTNVVLLEIPVRQLDELRYNVPEFRLFGQTVLENELAANLKTDIDYRSLTAKEKLTLLRNAFPGIENLVPHQLIASYLGITNVSLSRLRKETV